MVTFNTIDDLERTGYWQQAKNLLYRDFLEKPGPEIVIRLGFICWYVPLEFGCIDVSEPFDRDSFTECLKEVTIYALGHYSDETDVLFFFGYMISLAAWYWCNPNPETGEFSDDVIDLEQRATAMLAKAHQLKPDNPIFTMVYLANICKIGAAYIKACKISRQIVQQRFIGAGEFDSYFRQVLTHHIEE